MTSDVTCERCGHGRYQHIYGDGPCRPGVPCDCRSFVGLDLTAEVEDLACAMADYMATRMEPWPDEALMRDAAKATVRLLFSGAIDNTRRLVRQIDNAPSEVS